MFADRVDAARQLAARLDRYRRASDTVILAIPRGGVVVGAALARALELPVDVILTKKIGHPLVPEYAIGVVNLVSEAIDREFIEREGIPRAYLEREISRIRAELRRRYEHYREGRPPTDLAGKTALIVDDGIATGSTIIAAIRLTRREGARRIVAAVPVAPADAVEELRRDVDEVACVLAPESFFAIGQFYDSFEQVSDDEAIRLLRAANVASRA